MTEEHDEALIERVAQHLFDKEMGYSYPVKDAKDGARFMKEARRIIYPPAPPKTRLQVARELLAAQYRSDKCPDTAHRISSGFYDDSKDMAAIIAALSLDKMED